MKIARIVERYPSSAEGINRGLMPNVYYLSKIQAEMGHDVTIYTMREPGQPDREIQDGLPIVRVEKPPLARTFAGVRICQAIAASDEIPDIVHSMNPLPLGWLHSRSRTRLPAKFALSVHSTIDQMGRIGGIPSVSKLYVHEFRELVLSLASEVDLVLPVSRFVRRELEMSGVNHGRIKVIASGVETEVFSESGRPVGPPFRVLYVGRFSRGKGLRYLLKAVDQLRNKHEIEVLLIGGSPEDDGYRSVLSEIGTLGLQNTVRVSPPVSHAALPRLYSSHDVLVLPSEREALGKVLLEAMACCRPVVATRSGGVTDVVDDGRTGRLIPPRDPRSLADAIEGLIDDEDLRRRMGLMARRRAMMFDWHAIARQYLNAFELIP